MDKEAVVAKEYAAAQTGCVIVDAAWGRVRVTGKNRVDFLHRMSTNDLLKLQVGQGSATVFTTPIARIIDRTVVYVREHEVLMLTSRGNQGRVLQWLRKYIFFNDDVQLQDVTEELGLVSLYGATVHALLQSITDEDFSTLPLHHWHATQLAVGEALIARADPIGEGGFHVLFAKAAQKSIPQVLNEAGAVSIGAETYQILRVEAGHPEFGHELGDDYIPLEANLWSDVSFSKGCYTGQEIIARMESRQRLAKQLVGLRFEGEVTLPAQLFSDEHEAGAVTSVAHSPVLGWIGLGYVKTMFAAPGQWLQARHTGQAVHTQVSGLPLKAA